MAAFAEESFGYDAYATHRPSYPSTLYTDHLLPYHQGPRSLLLDLGCGPGIVTRPLSRHFARALGVDPSAGMLAAARATTPPAAYPNIEYRAAGAETLPFLRAAEADMAVAAQCAHWFSYREFWAEMARVVRPGGTVACWGYKDPAFVGKRAASVVVARYTHAADKLGPYWTRPGRDRVQGRYRCVVPPEAEWEDVERWEYETSFPDGDGEEERWEEGEEEIRKLGYTRELDEEAGMVGKLVKRDEALMKMSIRLGELELYARTWSAVHAWKEAHPQRIARKDGGSGDLMDELFDELRQVVPEWNVEGWKELVVDVELGHGLVCARRKGGDKE